MDGLLAVLTKADERLMRRAHRTLAAGVATSEKSQADVKDADNSPSEETDLEAHFKRQYNDIFTARDIANPLLSFDANTPVTLVKNP